MQFNIINPVIATLYISLKWHHSGDEKKKENNDIYHLPYKYILIDI